ncbi:MAG: hypothetical protein OXE40_18555 [Gammaproteobacteria bacterium]|nr:hypothetical protein [Gammaproteobacteria bacterium]
MDEIARQIEGVVKRPVASFPGYGEAWRGKGARQILRRLPAIWHNATAPGPARDASGKRERLLLYR